MHEISIIKQADLTLLTEQGLLTQENQKALTVAAASIPAMRDGSVGDRHFKSVSSVLSIRSNSPIDQARDVLATLDHLWSGASTEFHRLRKMHFEIKLQQVKVNIKKKNADKGSPDDREVTEAEVALVEAEIDGLMAEAMVGQERLKGVVTKAVAQSQKYQELCTTAGVESFTADHFLRDEVGYLIKSAFWHAGQTFKVVDGRDTKERGKDKGMSDFDRRRKARKFSAPRVDMNTGVWFEALGISKGEVLAELRDIEQQKEELSRAQSGWPWGTDFYPYFEIWLTKMEQKYAQRVMDSVKKQGPDRLKRLQTIITPTDADRGKNTVGEEMDRGSMFDP